MSNLLSFKTLAHLEEIRNSSQVESLDDDSVKELTDFINLLIDNDYLVFESLDNVKKVPSINRFKKAVQIWDGDDKIGVDRILLTGDLS